MDTASYFQMLEKDVRVQYAVANDARSKGFDPQKNVEIPLARSLAEKVVGLISTIYPQMNGTGIADRILELEKDWGKLDPGVALKISEEVAQQKFCAFKDVLEAIDAGSRIGFAYVTLGVVSSPIEGLTHIKVMKTREGKEYLSPYYSGPVRSAGGTGAAFSLVIIDHLREIFGFAPYDPTEQEIKRYVTELTDYHERITNLQYMPTEDEIIFLAKNIPLQVNGDASETLEVSNYKNLDRIETNFIRNGVCLTIGEGLAQKAAKIKRYVSALRTKGFKLSQWDFLDGYVELHKKRDTGKADASPTYIKDIVAGRPIFGHPSQSGGFRFRYGRGRTSGFSAASLHPATMAITDRFIAIGTQLKIEKPTKGCAITSCDIIDGPIVKFTNGSVKKITSQEEAKKVYASVDEIIYLGDILFPFSDLANRNHELIKPGYVEEWWTLELREKNKELEDTLDCFSISLDLAEELSQTQTIPLHPSYIFYWTQISNEQGISLFEWFSNALVSNKFVLPYTKNDRDRYATAKRALELLGVEHEVTLENVVISPELSRAFCANVGLDSKSLFSDREFAEPLPSFAQEHFKKLNSSFLETSTVLSVINQFSKYVIKDKAGDFIGTRMGRPEKAKLRKLTGSPNTLFSVGSEGGRLRSVLAACQEGSVYGSFPFFYCDTCQKESIYPTCDFCTTSCTPQFYCPDCKSLYKHPCQTHTRSMPYQSRSIPVQDYLTQALKKLGFTKQDLPVLIKGIRGSSSEKKTVEHLAKGILRAKHELQVNKDGTIRLDATELPLISFKPLEISVGVEKLKQLGYDFDIYGEPLERDDQILELKPHDVVLPCSPETPDEKFDDVFIRICSFIDDLLEKFYKLPRFYNLSSKEDLVGHLGVCMAPHNCAGVVCRFIGFSKTQGILASPYMHAAIRRDCDGDEAAVMLLLDVLLNFSREFLPSHRGGTQDAPLVLNAKIDAGEVDDQILDFELVYEYPLSLYQLAEQRKHSSEIKIPIVKSRLKEGKDPFVHVGFTHDTSDFNKGVLCSSYKSLATMQEKVQHQMELVERIRAADTKDTARLIIERHFIRDMRGNLRKFSMQQFRCVGCNESYRRVPLTGNCLQCRGKLIFTINEGGIKKYLDPATDLVVRYNLPSYVRQSVELTREYIDSVFGKEAEKQASISKWF